jgi:hypothetical protein
VRIKGVVNRERKGERGRDGGEQNFAKKLRQAAVPSAVLRGLLMFPVWSIASNI